MNKTYLIAGVVVVIFVVVVMYKKTPKANPIKENIQSSSSLSSEKVVGRTKSDELKKEDLVVGTGQEAQEGDTVKVDYRGILLDGTQFDSSYERKQPFLFTIGGGQVIRGWDEGVLGMKIGGKRRLIIPPALAYGDHGVPGAIPPKATLTFEIELLGIQ